MSWNAKANQSGKINLIKKKMFCCRIQDFFSIPYQSMFKYFLKKSSFGFSAGVYSIC
jgi:hypothetical protein